MDDIDFVVARQEKEWEKAMKAREVAAAIEAQLPPATWCSECGEEIPAERLQVHPTARMCVKCKAATER